MPALRDRPDGASIVNYSSTASGPPLSRVLTYSIAKAGVNSLTMIELEVEENFGQSATYREVVTA